MARNTSAYTNNRSERPSSVYFDAAPPPTAKKPAAPEPPPFDQESKQASTSYATTGGEKTFFSSSGLGRSSTGRSPSGSYRASNSRANPPSPVHGQQERHRSASPKARRNRTYSLSTSSSDLDEDTDETAEEVRRPSAFKPKAVPKSRLRPHQKFADFYRHENSSSGNGEEPPTRPSTQGIWPPPPPNGFRKPRRVSAFVDLTADSDENKGHNSDSAAFPKGSYKRDSQAQSPDLGARYVFPPYLQTMSPSAHAFYTEPTRVGMRQVHSLRLLDAAALPICIRSSLRKIGGIISTPLISSVRRLKREHHLIRKVRVALPIEVVQRNLGSQALPV